MYYLTRSGLALVLILNSLAVSADVHLQAKVLLSGAYDNTTGLMRDSLRSLNYLPSQQPYTNSPFDYTGSETVSATRLAQTGNQAIVDWALLELRDKNDPSLISEQKSVLIQRDGNLIDPSTEQTTLVFNDLEPDNYHISIRHRNHLGVTSAPLFLDTAPTLVDFTDPNLVTVGTNGRKITANKALLWAGDADTNSQLIIQGANNDTNTLLANVLIAQATNGQNFNYRLKGYYNTDLNLDGSTLYAGNGNDLNILQANVLTNPVNTSFNKNLIVSSTLPEGKLDLMAQALRTGNGAKVTINDLVNEIDKTQNTIDTNKQTTIKSIFKLNTDGSQNSNSITNIDWNPSHDSVVFNLINNGNNIPLLVSNHTEKATDIRSNLLAVAGQKANGARYALLGANALHDLTRTSQFGGTGNSNLQLFLESLLAWLTKNDSLKTSSAKIVIAHQPDSYWFKQDATTHQWFSTHYPKATPNTQDSCESANLANCLTNANLLVIGRDEGTDDNHQIPFNLTATVNAVKQAQSRGIPVLYLQYDGNANSLSNALLDYFGLSASDNYWRQDDLLSFNPSSLLTAPPSGLDALPITIKTLMSTTVDFAYNNTNCLNSFGRIACDPSIILDNSSGKTQQVLFYDGLNAARSALTALDSEGKNVFKLDNGFRLLKLALLLADKIRPTITYPMDKQTTADSVLLKSLFADNIINFNRPNNILQPQLGSFSANTTAINQLPNKTIEITQTPTNFNEWTSTGIYIPAGKAITLTRTDNTNTITRLKINFQRSNITRVWNTNGYNRPQYMSSSEINLVANRNYNISSPHGGILYLGWDATSNTNPIKLTANNVLDSLFLTNFDEASIQTFANSLNTSPLEWVDIKTPYAELHTLKSYLFKSFNNQDGNSSNGYTTADIKAYINDLNNYLIAGNYNYAGFSGVGLPPLNTAVLSFCSSLGLDNIVYEGSSKNLCTDAAIHSKPAIQHINADINAQCGSLCAGNPFDSSSPIQPLDWGENHEMGHNLQRSRLKIYNSKSSEVSNNIFPLHTLWQATQNKGLTTASIDRPNHQNAFKILQTNIAANTPANSNHPLWSGTGIYDLAFERLSFYIQLMYTEGNWDFYTKMYIMERILTHAVQNDLRWNAVKDQLGLSQYTRSAASSLNGNDFMYLAASKIAGKDYRNYFSAWGIAVSQAAQDQVTANGLTNLVPALFYYVQNELPVAMPTLADTLPLNGTSAWLDPTP